MSVSSLQESPENRECALVDQPEKAAHSRTVQHRHNDVRVFTKLSDETITITLCAKTSEKPCGVLISQIADEFQGMPWYVNTESVCGCKSRAESRPLLVVIANWNQSAATSQSPAFAR